MRAKAIVSAIGWKSLPAGPGERVDGEVSGDDDGDRVKDGTVDVTSSGEDNFVELVVLSLAQAELTVDILDHHDGAIDDDAEVDGADGEKVGGFAGSVKKDEGKQKREGNGERGNDSCANADEKKDAGRRGQAAMPRRRLPSTVSVVTRTRSLRS